jgi:hypothetical protein
VWLSCSSSPTGASNSSARALALAPPTPASRICTISLPRYQEFADGSVEVSSVTSALETFHRVDSGPAALSLRGPKGLPRRDAPSPHRLLWVAVLAGHVTVKDVALVPVPPAVVTEILPVVAPAGTLATIVVAVSETIVAE